MEHSLHIAAKHFVEKISSHHSDSGEGIGASNDEEPDDEDFDSSDSLGKAIALVKQVSLSLPAQMTRCQANAHQDS
jgi:hypothetical protein